MKQRIFNLLYIGATALAVANLASCNKTGGFQDPSFSRMFMPNSALKATTDATTATLSWGSSLYNDTAANKIYYVLQLSSDAAFTSIVRTDTTTALNKKYTDADLAVKKDYYPQVKVLGVNGAGDSKWLQGNKFSIVGENLFLTPSPKDVQYVTAILRWKHQDGLTKVRITTNGVSVDSLISADTLLLRGLTMNTTYTAELFKSTASKGTVTFTTKNDKIFTKIIDPTSNLITEINNAANGDVIGLKDGTYDCGAVNPIVLQKNISIISYYGDPSTVVITNSKEIILKGNNAGLTISGVTFDGANGIGASYFVVLNGNATTGEATTFTGFTADNCVINLKSGATTLLRGSYGTNANDHKIGNIRFNNCIANVNVTGSQNYGGIMCDKLQFDSVILTKSTFYNIARGIIGYTAKMNARSNTSVTVPVVKIDQCTFNSFGQQGRAAVLDGNTDVANQVSFFLTNSVLANTPDALAATTVNANAFVGYASNVYTLTNNSVYNCVTAASGGTAIIWPGTTPTTVTLPWTTSTTNFALPASVPNNGDPRWYH